MNFPEQAERVQLPDGRVLEDAVVWPGFAAELGIDVDALWRELLDIPTWADDQAIPFREHGDSPHWITGRHAALRYRGRELKRDKIWCQSDYATGLRRYGYTGWQHRISYATHAAEHVAPIARFADRLNGWLYLADQRPHNHWIATRYRDKDYSIGFHSDKDKDFAPGSYFVVLKLGAARLFELREVGQVRPFFSRMLDAGTAVFVRCCAEGCANDWIQHGVPPMADDVGASGSIVSRCIDTVVPWERVRREVEKRR